MTTHIGTIDSAVEVVPADGSAAQVRESPDELLPEEQRLRLTLNRMRLVAMRTRAEGFDD